MNLLAISLILSILSHIFLCSGFNSYQVVSMFCFFSTAPSLFNKKIKMCPVLFSLTLNFSIFSKYFAVFNEECIFLSIIWCEIVVTLQSFFFVVVVVFLSFKGWLYIWAFHTDVFCSSKFKINNVHSLVRSFEKLVLWKTWAWPIQVGTSIYNWSKNWAWMKLVKIKWAWIKYDCIIVNYIYINLEYN